MNELACPAPQQLHAFQLGKLSAPDAQAVTEHVSRCAQCRAIVQSFSSETVGARGPTVSSNRGVPSPIKSGVEPSAPPAAAPAFPFLAPPVLPDEIGRLGGRRVFRLLGRGGMGFVFHAEHIALRRQEALKVMNPELGGELEGFQRFLREAQIMASLRHEHLVLVYDVGQEGKAIYLAMELLKGESLDKTSARHRPFPLKALMRIGREVAAGLAVIHAHKMVHRDIKPANIWLEAPAGRVKILDFGLARLLDDDTHLTQSGTVLGTPSFMSPEQARGDKVDGRSDLFSLGSVLYALATGEPPFQAANTMAVLSALAIKNPQPPHALNAALPLPLSRFIMELLAKDPAHRPPSAEAVAERLRQLESGATAVAVPVAAVPAAIAVPVAVPSAIAVPFTPPTPSAAGSATLATRRPTVWPPWMKFAALGGGAALLLVLILKLALPSRKSATNSGQNVVQSSPPSPSQTGQPRRLVYLADLEPVAKESWPFEGHPPKKDDDPKKDDPPEIFTVVRVNGERRAHGIFMHPALPPKRGLASLTYALGKKYTTFRAIVTLNDGPLESEAPLTFTVYGNGSPLWTSKKVSSQADAQECNVSVKGIDKLKIQVECEGEPRGAHAVWVDPRVE